MPGEAGRETVLDGVSFIVTLFNKRPYLPLMLDYLRRQQGAFAREFIFVDDGSSDGSADLVAGLTRDWADPVIVMRQANRGASAATNSGAARASHRWLKLVDGDDLLLPGATRRLIEAAEALHQDFAYGDLGYYRPDDPPPLDREFPCAPIEGAFDGLARFIHSCPANSSSILVSARRYREAGGCDERIGFPDPPLFLRLFARGGGAHVAGPVALVPELAPGRLSLQVSRGYYEWGLALYYLVTETPDLDPKHARLAYRRALSRAYRLQQGRRGRVWTRHFLRLARSWLDPAIHPEAMYEALSAFTANGSSERPAEWRVGPLAATSVRRADRGAHGARSN
jgi:glycosyltransferase involved in cell wall biosynthesis